jgi:hypothetical protein
MKLIQIGLLLNFLAIALPARACFGPAEEFTIFFDRKLGTEDNYVRYNAPPQSQGHFKVQIKSVKKGITAKILSIPQDKRLPVKVGSLILLDYKNTSCTQPLVVGEIGTIAIQGFVNNDDRPELKAYIYTRRYGDGKLQ